MRDRDLDIYRGFVMLYITCFIHVIYGNSFISSPLKSLILVEMPAIFLLAGASFSLSKKKTYVEYMTSRLNRVLKPYWIYAVVCVFLCFIAGFLKPDYFLTFGDLMNWFILFDPQTPIPFIGWHIWFILPYLLLSLLIPGCYFLVRKYAIRQEVVLLTGLILTGMADWLEWSELPRMLIVYGVFYVMGFYYKQKKSPALIWGILLAGLLVCLSVGYGWDMQLNKFPPNLMFAIYTYLVLFTFNGALKKVCLFLYGITWVKSIVDIYAVHGFTIYLYHSFSLLFLRIITDLSGLGKYLTANYGYLVIYLVSALIFILVTNLFFIKTIQRIGALLPVWLIRRIA